MYIHTELYTHIYVYIHPGILQVLVATPVDSAAGQLVCPQRDTCLAPALSDPAAAAGPRSIRSLLQSPCGQSFQCWCNFGDV